MGKYEKIPKIDVEFPIPEEWRLTFFNINECFVSKDFSLSKAPPCVSKISTSLQESIENSIIHYGDDIVSLTPESWNTSICRWEGHWWITLVDLCTQCEGVSDLVMFSKVFEDGESFRFEVQSVHVP